MTNWKPLHRDARYLDRVADRAKQNSREIDRIRGWLAWSFASVVFILALVALFLLSAALSSGCSQPPAGYHEECVDPIPCLRVCQSVAGAAFSAEEAILTDADATEMEGHAGALARRAEHCMHCSTDLMYELLDPEYIPTAESGADATEGE